MEVPVQLSQPLSFTVTSKIVINSEYLGAQTTIYVRTDNNTFIRSVYTFNNASGKTVKLGQNPCTEEELIKHVARRCHFHNAVLPPAVKNDTFTTELINRIILEWRVLRTKSSSPPILI
jgi:hypothetical protein